MSANQPAPITVAIQAGGKSTRMGRDKSFVPFEGRPMIEVVRDRVTGLGQELILICNNLEPYAYLDLPTYGDVFVDHGPLGGIHSALFHARFPHVLVVACDMPWLNLDLLRYLIAARESADIIVPRWQKFPEPLHAVYSKTCLPSVEENLKAGNLKITRFFGSVSVRFIEREEIARFDPAGRSFTNVNQPQDLPD